MSAFGCHAQTESEIAALKAEITRLTTERDRALDRIEEMAAEVERSSVPEGWQLVPVEPTKTMALASYEWERDNTTPMYSKIYAAMLKAAPKPGDGE